MVYVQKGGQFGKTASLRAVLTKCPFHFQTFKDTLTMQTNSLFIYTSSCFCVSGYLGGTQRQLSKSIREHNPASLNTKPSKPIRVIKSTRTQRSNSVTQHTEIGYWQPLKLSVYASLLYTEKNLQALHLHGHNLYRSALAYYSGQYASSHIQGQTPLSFVHKLITPCLIFLLSAAI